MIVGTLLLNPIANLQLMKQVVRGSEVEPPSYGQILKQSGVRMFTLGYTAHLARNYMIMCGFVP